jgi:hypothetical protein
MGTYHSIIRMCRRRTRSLTCSLEGAAGNNLGPKPHPPANRSSWIYISTLASIGETVKRKLRTVLFTGGNMKPILVEKVQELVKYSTIVRYHLYLLWCPIFIITPLQDEVELGAELGTNVMLAVAWLVTICRACMAVEGNFAMMGRGGSNQTTIGVSLLSFWGWDDASSSLASSRMRTSWKVKTVSQKSEPFPFELISSWSGQTQLRSNANHLTKYHLSRFELRSCQAGKSRTQHTSFQQNFNLSRFSSHG